MKISGSKILIIGGSSGLGLGIAKECASNGAQVTIASRSEEKLRNSVLEVGNEAKYHVADISSKKSIYALFESVGNIDHLVVTSGFITGKNLMNCLKKMPEMILKLTFGGNSMLVNAAQSTLIKETQ